MPDARRPRAAEIWSVDAGTRDIARRLVPPVAPVPPADRGRSRTWRPWRLLPRGSPPGRPGVPGTEVFLAPHDPDFDPDKPAEAVLSVDALCVNRDLPSELPFGGGHPRLRLVEGAAAIAALSAVTAATPTLRPPLRESGFWRLVSHLSLGHLSVTGGPEGAAALKEVLRLYDLRDSAETRAAIEALIGVTAGPGHGARSGPGRRLLPRPGRHPGIRPARLAGRRALSARRGAGALPCAARHGQQLHPHPRHPARPPRHRRRLAGPQRHPRARMRAPHPRWRAARAREPRRFRFDAAVRVLTRARRAQDPADAVRFRSPAGLVYPPADVIEVRQQGDASAGGDGRADGPDRPVRRAAALLLGSRHPDAAGAFDGAARLSRPAGAPVRRVLRPRRHQVSARAGGRGRAAAWRVRRAIR